MKSATNGASKIVSTCQAIDLDPERYYSNGGKRVATQEQERYEDDVNDEKNERGRA